MLVYIWPTLNLTIKDKPEEHDVTPITGTTIRRPRPSASTVLEFTSPSQKTHESTSTQQIVPTLIHPPEQLEQEHDKLSEVYETENYKNEHKEGENEEWKEPEGLQMASNSFLIEVKFIFSFLRFNILSGTLTNQIHLNEITFP